jgi:SSS family solute:Na+ symporter
MQLVAIDWVSIVAYFVISLLIGVMVTKRAGSSTSEFFLSGRRMPWWLLGVSLVATTFSTDTPNLVTDIVRQHGVGGNWVWWAFLLTGMLTVFVYAQLWRRSGVMTDVEFYELRYSGESAAFLRGFRALYLGVVFNIMIMAAVTLAAIKIGEVMFGFTKLETITIAALVTTVYSMLGGYLGVLLTDFFQFFIAMIGAFAAAYFALGHEKVGGLANLLAHENVADKLALIPEAFNADGGLSETFVALLVVPLAVQWWSVWYPSVEPGGGGYVAQRMLSAKSEDHAVGATFFFNVAHYALRPWPWIIVALCSLLVFPTLSDLQTAFPGVDSDIVKHDLAYSAMLKERLPAGWLGLVVASLIAAYMSTIATHLNWGSSYFVNDFYRRFVAPDASERHLVFVGRICTAALMVVACYVAMQIQNAKQMFDVMLQFTAGTGLVFILRWFWWRVNAASEFTAMVVAAVFAIGLFVATTSAGQLRSDHDLAENEAWASVLLEDTSLSGAQRMYVEVAPLSTWQHLLASIVLTTAAWIAVAFLTKPADEATLRSFFRLVHPGGPGWRPVVERAAADGDPIDTGKGWGVPLGIICMLVDCLAVYSSLFATGYWIYGNTMPAMVLTVIALGSSVSLAMVWPKLRALC